MAYTYKRGKFEKDKSNPRYDRKGEEN